MPGETVSVPDGDAEPTGCRRFGLSDAMILIGGLAIALSMGSHLLKFSVLSFVQLCVQAGLNWPVFWRHAHDPFTQMFWYGFQFLGILLFALTPVFFVLRLRRPRPPWRALLVQPGTVAGLAMVFGLFWVTCLLHLLIPGRIDSMTGPSIAIGGSVAAAWIVLALSRKWRAEPGWVDHLGRMLGATAIGTALLGLVIFRL